MKAENSLWEKRLRELKDALGIDSAITEASASNGRLKDVVDFASLVTDISSMRSRLESLQDKVERTQKEATEAKRLAGKEAAKKDLEYMRLEAEKLSAVKRAEEEVERSKVAVLRERENMRNLVKSRDELEMRLKEALLDARAAHIELEELRIEEDVNAHDGGRGQGGGKVDAYRIAQLEYLLESARAELAAHAK